MRVVSFIGLVFCSALTFSALAASPEITQENWRDQAPEICGDPEIDFLRAVIFPIEYETYLEERLPNGRYKNEAKSPSEYILTVTKDGLGLQRRMVPSRYHPKIRRIIKHQYVAYVNRKGNLVDKNGTLISNSRQFENPWNNELYLEKVLVRDTPSYPDHFRNRADDKKLANAQINAAPECSYLELPASYERSDQLYDVKLRNLVCDGASYSLRAETLSNETRKAQKLLHSTNLWVKDLNGKVHEFESTSFFQSYSPKNVCQYEKLEFKLPLK